MNLTNSQQLVLFAFIGVVTLLIVVLANKQNLDIQTNIRPTPFISTNTTAKVIPHSTKLSKEDALAKEKLLLKILHGPYSGVVYESSRVRVEYIKSLDRFTAEILTSNTAQTKHEVTEWFQSNGISQQGVCKLPVMFHLSIDAESELGEAANSFNPLPEGC